MSSFPMEVGRVVFSKAGRDAGHYFVVVAVLDKDHVAIANGCQRKVDNPKKKKIKHLVAKPEILEEIREKIFAKKRIFDSEVRNKLDAIGYQEALLPASSSRRCRTRISASSWPAGIKSWLRSPARSV